MKSILLPNFPWITGRWKGTCTRCSAVSTDGKRKAPDREDRGPHGRKLQARKSHFDDSREEGGRHWKKKPLPRRKAYERRKKVNTARVTGTFFSPRSFERCHVNEDMIHALMEMGIERPSHIQAMSLNAFEEHEDRHILIADHAGSGKTLAYLIPLLQRLKEKEKLEGRPLTKPNHPKVVIVTPTAELAAQVLSVCRAISRTLPFRSVAVTGGRPMKTHKQFLDEGADVVVGTPGRISELIRQGSLKVDECSSVVVEEVDVLLGESFDFRKMTIDLMQTFGVTQRQFIFVTATIPKTIFLDIETFFKNLALVLGPSLHRSAPGVEEQLVDCSGGAEVTEESGQRRKMAALLSLLQNHDTDRIVVFCNKIDTCRQVENFLNRNAGEHMVVPFHGAISPENRRANMKVFMKPRDEDLGPIVMVCTDRASRGIDTSRVGHVILFDFPRDPSEYVRRVGRTARGASGGGLVSVLVLGRQVKIAQRIIDKNQKGVPIHEIPDIYSA